jgi:hypothetical protein
MQLQFEVRGGVTADGQAAVETIIVQDGVTTTFTLPVPEVGKLLKGYKDAIRQAATALGARNGIAPPLESLSASASSPLPSRMRKNWRRMRRPNRPRATERVDREYARLMVSMGTPKYRVAERFGVGVRTLNAALRRRK